MARKRRHPVTRGVLVGEGTAYSYDSDVWALGLSVMECATGQFPYEHTSEVAPASLSSCIPNPIPHMAPHKDPAAIFWDLLHAIVNCEPPTLPADGGFSESLHAFVAACLKKAPADRASAAQLLEAPFICEAGEDAEVAAWFREHVAAAQKKGVVAEDHA